MPPAAAFHIRRVEALVDRSPELRAGELRVDVARQGARRVAEGRHALEHLPRAGLPQAESVLARFEARPDLQPPVVRRELDEVDGVAVPEARRVETAPVVIDGHLPVDDLVAPVEIDVADAQVVVPLTGIALRLPRFLPAVELPAPRQLPAVPVPGGKDTPVVVAAAHDERGMDAVEVRDA